MQGVFLDAVNCFFVGASVLRDLDVIDRHNDVIFCDVDSTVLVDEQRIKQLVGLLHSVSLRKRVLGSPTVLVICYLVVLLGLLDNYILNWFINMSPFSLLLLQLLKSLGILRFICLTLEFLQL